MERLLDRSSTLLISTKGVVKTTPFFSSPVVKITYTIISYCNIRNKCFLSFYQLIHKKRVLITLFYGSFGEQVCELCYTQIMSRISRFIFVQIDSFNLTYFFIIFKNKIFLNIIIKICTFFIIIYRNRFIIYISTKMRRCIIIISTKSFPINF